MYEFLILVVSISGVVCQDGASFNIFYNGFSQVINSKKSDINYTSGLVFQVDCIMSKLSGPNTVYNMELSLISKDNNRQLLKKERTEYKLEYSVRLNDSFDGSVLRCDITEDGKLDVFSRELAFHLIGAVQPLPENKLFVYVLVGLGAMMAVSLLVIVIIAIVQYHNSKKRKRPYTNEPQYAEPVVFDNSYKNSSRLALHLPDSQ